jgi:hypothetical protein
MSWTYAGRWGADNFINPKGGPLTNTAIAVTISGTSTPATLYTDRSKSTVVSQVATDSNGNFYFYADPGVYDLSANGQTLVTVEVEPDSADIDSRIASNNTAATNAQMSANAAIATANTVSANAVTATNLATYPSTILIGGSITTLANDITDTISTTITVSAAPSPNLNLINLPIVVDSENMLVTAIDSTGLVWTVTRGYNSTTAATHSSGVNIYNGNLTVFEIDSANINTLGNIFIIKDHAGSPIAWFKNAGGFGVSDNIKMYGNTLTSPLIALEFTGLSGARTNEKLVFGNDGTASTGTTIAAGTGTAIYRELDGYSQPTLVWSTNGHAAFKTNSNGVMYEYSSGAPFLAPNPSTIPVANSGQALTTSLASITGGVYLINPTFWAAPTNRTLQFRAVVIFSGGTSGDVIGVDVYDTASSSVVIAETTNTIDTAGNTRVATTWANVATHEGVVRVRNQTAARANARAAWLEFQYV